MLFFLFHPFLFSFRVRFKRNELKNLVIVRAVSDIWGFAPSSFPAFFLSFFSFFFMLFCFKFVVNDNSLPTFQTVIFKVIIMVAVLWLVY